MIGLIGTLSLGIALATAPLNAGAIHDAAKAGKLDEMQNQLESNVDINIQDRDGQTALHIAAAEHHQDIVKFLLKSGADVTLRDRWNHTPYDWAVNMPKTSGQHKTVGYLKDYYGQKSEEKMERMREKHADKWGRRIEGEDKERTRQIEKRTRKEQEAAERRQRAADKQRMREEKMREEHLAREAKQKKRGGYGY